MPFINFPAREINCKLVYYGPGLGGKTANLQWIYEHTGANQKGKMVSLATETDRDVYGIVRRANAEDGARVIGVVGFIAFVIVSGIVLYKPIMYGDMIENFGIVMMLTVPVIAAVAFRVGLDSWLDAE